MKRLLLAAALAATMPLAVAKHAPAPMPEPTQPAKPLAPFTYNDLVRLDRVLNPVSSPDGRLVAYGLRATNYEGNKGVQSVWLVPADGSAEPRAVAVKSGASDPQFGPQGQLYFLSPRSGSMQVWRTPVDGGPSVQVTNLPLDVASYTVSQDGSRLAVALEVFPDAATLADSKARLDALAKNPTAGTLHTRLFIRHWDTDANGTRSQLFTLALKDGKASGAPVAVSKSLDGDAPSKPHGGSEEYTLSADGKTLYFSLREAGKTEAWSTNLDVFAVPSDGSAAPKNLTASNLATDVGPVLSPDGKTLAYRAMKRPKFEADRYAIMLRDLATGTTREIAANWDRSAETLVFSADGKTLYTRADEQGQNRLFSIDIASGNVSALTPDGTVEGFALTRNGVVVAHNTLGRPTDLFVVAGKQMTQITRHNSAAVKAFSTSPYEQFSFAGWNGETVYGYVVKPTGYVEGKKYPVAFIVHGGPQGSMGNHWHYRWNPQTYAGAGYAVVFIDFHGSTGYGQAFTDSISGDWGGKPLEDLQKGWAHALKTYPYLNADRAAALGASYGGYMMNWIAGNWPDAFKAIVCHSGIFDNRSMGYTTEELWFDEWEHKGTPYENPQAYEKHNPVNFVNNWKTPMLVIHGAKDYRVPLDQGVAAFTALQRKGIDSEMLTFPTENHWILKPQNSVLWHQTVEAWLAKYLKP